MFDADSRLSQLLSWEVLCPQGISLLITADSTIMVTFVVLTRMIGLPNFAMVLSEMLLRSKGEATVHGSVRSCNGCFRYI